MQIDMKQPILDKNDRLAQENRALFAEKRVFVLDLLASPGSGKTSTILATIEALRDEFNIAVIEGDIASDVDAKRIGAQGIAAVQINTGGACHLESDMIRRAVDALDLDNLDLIIVENVGNLVCPTDFDLGEGAKVMILSVPEGDVHCDPRFARAAAIGRKNSFRYCSAHFRHGHCRKKAKGNTRRIVHLTFNTASARYMPLVCCGASARRIAREMHYTERSVRRGGIPCK